MFQLATIGRENHFEVILSLTGNCDWAWHSKNEMLLKAAFDHRNEFFISTWKLLNLNFKEWKYSQDYSLKMVLNTLVSKIVCGYVTLFQLEKYRLIYWINVREQFKMHVIDCLSVIKHWLWRTSKESFSSLLQFFYLQCCAITIFLRFNCKGLNVKLK